MFAKLFWRQRSHQNIPSAFFCGATRISHEIHRAWTLSVDNLMKSTSTKKFCAVKLVSQAPISFVWTPCMALFCCHARWSAGIRYVENQGECIVRGKFGLGFWKGPKFTPVFSRNIAVWPERSVLTSSSVVRLFWRVPNRTYEENESFYSTAITTTCGNRRLFLIKTLCPWQRWRLERQSGSWSKQVWRVLIFRGWPVVVLEDVNINISDPNPSFTKRKNSK